MIKTEHLTINGRTLIRTYSDEGRYVVRNGVSYEEAIDPAGKDRVYTEGNIIGTDDHITDDTELSDDEITTILTGGSL